MKQVNANEIENNINGKFVVSGAIFGRTLFPIKIEKAFGKLIAELPFNIFIKSGKINIDLNLSEDDLKQYLPISDSGEMFYNDILVGQVLIQNEVEMWIIEADTELGSRDRQIYPDKFFSNKNDCEIYISKTLNSEFNPMPKFIGKYII